MSKTNTFTRNEVVSEVDNKTLVHSPIYPAEVYGGDNVKAQIQIEGMAEIHSLQVWRLSPLGVELKLTEEMLHLTEQLTNGKTANLKINMGQQECNFSGIVVSSVTVKEKSGLVAFRWVTNAAENNGIHDNRRETRRWLCGDDFMPTGSAPNPTRFGDFIHFRTADISREGMQLLLSLRNKYLIPGMVLDSTISFPMFGLIKVNLKVVHARVVGVNGKDFLSLGVQFVKPKTEMLQVLANYLLQFGPEANAADLREEKLLPKIISGRLDYGYVRTKEEYEEVVLLRKACYLQAGKLRGNEPMTDVFDSRSRIVIAKYKGKIVGSLRVMFHDPDDQLELQQFVSLPEEFPRNDEIVEVSRFCIHPDFQGGDLIFGMMKQLFLVMAQARRRWIVSFASPGMMKSFYIPFGGKVFGEKFSHQSLNGVVQIPFTFDVPRLVNGLTVGPIKWNILFSDIFHYMYDNEFYEFKPGTGIRIAFYKLFAPIAYFFKKKLERMKVSPEV